MEKKKEVHFMFWLLLWTTFRGCHAYCVFFQHAVSLFLFFEITDFIIMLEFFSVLKWHINLYRTFDKLNIFPYF